MAHNYTRQQSYNTGDPILAAHSNDEFNQLVNAFYYSDSVSGDTGHRHDGSAGQGGNIHVIGDIDFNNKIEVDGSGNHWGFFVESGGAPEEQLRLSNGLLAPVTNNDVDLGSVTLQYKDIYVAGVAELTDINAGGDVEVTGLFTFANISDGAITIESFIDEDDMSSDSATKVPTQQSVKAYVDSEISAAAYVIETTGANNAGWGALTGLTNGTNANFTVTQGSFKSGSCLVWYGTSGVLVTEFTETPGTGTITLPFNASDRVTVQYVPS